MDYAPPYLNETKYVQKLKKEVLLAEQKEKKAIANLEFATEYKKICQEKLDKALKDEK